MKCLKISHILIIFIGLIFITSCGGTGTGTETESGASTSNHPSPTPSSNTGISAPNKINLSTVDNIVIHKNGLTTSVVSIAATGPETSVELNANVSRGSPGEQHYQQLFLIHQQYQQQMDMYQAY